jgi:hypothetical protein
MNGETERRDGDLETDCAAVGHVSDVRSQACQDITRSVDDALTLPATATAMGATVAAPGWSIVGATGPSRRRDVAEGGPAPVAVR